MAFKTVFKRYEIKYLITQEQKRIILEAMEPYMSLDEYGRSTIRNIYFDTDNFRLIRASIDKPTVYKEKLRIRSYGLASPDSTVFVELKKKYKSVVYKRRISLDEASAMAWVCDRVECPKQKQITHEIDYFLDYYQSLKPMIFLSYEREAFFTKSGDDFRVTFDENILYRWDDLSLCSEVGGKAILPEGMTLMEIKTSGGMPLWMTHTLSENGIFKTSFSKYGNAYREYLSSLGKPIYSTYTEDTINV